MATNNSRYYSNRTHKLNQPQITLPKGEYSPIFAAATQEGKEEDHKELLSYLTERLDAGQVDRQARTQRYARIDRIVSTWQILSQMDSKRQEKQDATGQAQAINVNLPLAQSHLDDMVAFFAGIYSPSNGSFFQTPDPTNAEIGKKLVDRLNTDAKYGAYYTQMAKAMRGFMKYNISGFHLVWSVSDLDADAERAEGKNLATALDMYNLMWDSSIKDPTKIAKEAEWAAISEVKNRRWFVMRQKRGFFHGVGHVIKDNEAINGVSAKYFRYPPHDAGVSAKDSQSTNSSTVDWDSFNASLAGEDAVPVEGFELVTMYCWLNPGDFGLQFEGQVFAEDDYYLWKFWIMDGCQVVRGEPVNQESDKPSEQDELEIPIYAGYMNVDDMGDAQRSIAELLIPFQTFGSFLMNSHIAGTRSSIWGLKGYDPSMFDLSRVEEGAVAGWLESKIPGRDVRSGMMKMDGSVDTQGTMSGLRDLLNLVREFFPSQALPSQVAGMDRAVTSQVSALMQGVSRRLHMLVRIMDDSVLGPMLYMAYKNLVEMASMSGIDDATARKILGSGLEQLNREAAEQAFRQLFFAVAQNPESNQTFNVPKMMAYWGSLMNSGVDMTTFAREQQQAAPAQGAPVQAAAPAPAQIPMA